MATVTETKPDKITLQDHEQYVKLEGKRYELAVRKQQIQTRLGELWGEIGQAPTGTSIEGDELLSDVLDQDELVVAGKPELRREMRDLLDEERKVKAALRKVGPMADQARREAERAVCAQYVDEHKQLQADIEAAMQTLREACKAEEAFRDRLRHEDDCEFRWPLQSVYPLGVAEALGRSCSTAYSN